MPYLEQLILRKPRNDSREEGPHVVAKPISIAPRAVATGSLARNNRACAGCLDVSHGGRVS